MVVLASVVLRSPSTVRSWTGLATYLHEIHVQSGRSLQQLETIGKGQVKNGTASRELKRSTISDALSGKHRINRELLESLLLAWAVSPATRTQVMDLWQRIYTSIGQGPPDAGRIDEATSRELGVHPAISVAGETDELPGYVARDFDDQLRDAIGRGTEQGCFVVLMGGSSCGKTRSLYEAVNDLVPDWWLVQPSRSQDVRDLLDVPPENTVLWLDELQRFLGAEPPLRKADIVALRRSGMIIVGTLWPEHYFLRRRLGDTGDVHAEDRQLLELAELIAVPDELSPPERAGALLIAETDARIGRALAASDGGLTQVLAAGPDLVNVWQQAPDPYSKALLRAAADARRLGVQGALSPSTLTAAIAGYLTPAEQVRSPKARLAKALPHATTQLYGAMSALWAVSDDEAGGVGGYIVADYLTQHIGRVHRTHCPPPSLWDALLAAVRDIDDLRRLASAALSRMRYQYAEPALRQLHVAGDQAATVELITLLRRQDRIPEAMVLADAWLAADQHDQRRRTVRSELSRAHARAEELRGQAAQQLRAEVLADGGQVDAARAEAAAGGAAAVEELADLLADRGYVDELRELAATAHRFAADRLAELLSNLGRTDELQQRAEAGDTAARLHLQRTTPHDDARAGAEIVRLQAAADAGDDDAADELTALLLATGDRDGLLAEVEAGTHRADERYLALLTADPTVDHMQVAAVRAHGPAAAITTAARRGSPRRATTTGQASTKGAQWPTI